MQDSVGAAKLLNGDPNASVENGDAPNCVSNSGHLFGRLEFTSRGEGSGGNANHSRICCGNGDIGGSCLCGDGANMLYDDGGERDNRALVRIPIGGRSANRGFSGSS